MLIGVDLDEVLADFTGTFVKYHNDTYGTNLVREQFFTLKWWKVLNLSWEETHSRLLDFSNSKYFSRMKPVEGSIDGVGLLSLRSKLVVVTARNDELYGVPIYDKTKDWISKYFDDKFSDVFFAHNSYFDGRVRKTKADICRASRLDFMIDDSLEFVIDVNNKSNGTKVLLFDCPWNQSNDLHKNIARVYGWKEIVDKIENGYE